MHWVNCLLDASDDILSKPIFNRTLATSWDVLQNSTCGLSILDYYGYFNHDSKETLVGSIYTFDIIKILPLYYFFSHFVILINNK